MKATKVTIFIGCLLFFQTFLFSQTTYTAVMNGNWDNADTWSPVGIPGQGDFVILTKVGTARVVEMTGQHEIAGFNIANGVIDFVGTNPTLTITDSAVCNDGELDGGNGANGGGSVNSNFIINPGAVFEVAGSFRLYEGLTLTNNGTIRQSGTEPFSIRGLSVLKNEGLFDVITDADFGGESFSGGTFLNTSTGVFRKSGGTDISSFNTWWDFQNQGGTIDAQSGSIHFIGPGTFDGGNYVAANNAAIDFRSSTQFFKGTLSGSPIGIVRLSGSTINIDSSGASLDFQGTGFQFSKGTLTGGGTLTIPEGSLLRLVPDPVDPTPFQFLYGGTTLLNLGTIRQESNTTFGANGLSIIDNHSLFEILTDADFSGGTGSGGTFYNTGTFRKSGGNDVTQMNIWWKFFNQSGGVIDASSGELEFSMSAINFKNPEGAIIKGIDTIDVPGGFINDGIIAPGSSVGVLTYVGNFISSSTGVLDIQLGGLTAGTEYDQLNVTGNATLNGSLKVRVANGFVPNNGDSFVILNTSGTVSSDFNSFDIQDGLYLTVIVYSNNVTLVVDSVGVLDVEELNDGEAVSDYSLSQNYPNPFNPSTNIQFALPQSGYVTLEIFSITGERVDVLISEELNAGKYNFEWNGSNLTSGIYLYRLKTGSFVETRKMVLLK